MIFLDLLQKIVYGILDTDGTTANTNIGFEARKTLTKAARDDDLMLEEKMLIQSSH